ncbi:MAG: hypothetical protein AAB455_00585 [Patescibacteria group bacterium]
MNGEQQMNQFPMAEKSSKGALFGTIIIILLIILGGIYILASRTPSDVPADETPANTTTDANGQPVTSFTTTAENTSVADLEAEATGLAADLGSLDQEVTQ